MGKRGKIRKQCVVLCKLCILCVRLYSVLVMVYVFLYCVGRHGETLPGMVGVRLVSCCCR